MRILVALGGNALLKRGEAAIAAAQQRDVEIAAQSLAALAEEHELIVTHGNGPQVGRVGHLLEVALHNALPDRDVVTVLPEVVVDAARGEGDGRRRPLGRLEPRAIAEPRSLRVLIESGALLVCGGGIPVTLDPFGQMRGVEAVVDKDLTSALLARRLDADLFLMLTGVDAVRLDWGEPQERPLAAATPAELRKLDFAASSMAPKVEAACRFVEATGGRAAIGSLVDAPRLASGEVGTQIEAAVAPALA